MPAADGAIIALALEADALVVSRDQTAWQPAETLFLAPGKSAIDSSRQIITHLRFPVPGGSWGTAWQRLGRRTALTLPILNCAVKVVLADGRIQRAVVALGPVAVHPFRARETEIYLAGKLPTPDTFTEAGWIAKKESHPHGNVLRASREYRLAILPVLIQRALVSAVKRAQGLVDDGI
jgi:carbon-monoxide dehydrogenase medium subunit